MERRLSGPRNVRLVPGSSSRISDEALRRPELSQQDKPWRLSGNQTFHAYSKPSSTFTGRRASASAERVTKSAVSLNRARPALPVLGAPQRRSSIPPPPPLRRTSLPSPPTTRPSPITDGSHVVIDGRSLQVGRRIGRGGYSTVFHATLHSSQPETAEQACALKVVTLEGRSDEEKRNLITEVKLLQSLTDVDHVIQLIACDVSASEALIVLELGQYDLRQILDRRKKALDLDFVRFWGGEMLKCIAAVHEHNIVHADLKPSNFLVVDAGLKIIDFGIANPVPDHTTSVHRETRVGTILYMAPETLMKPDTDCDYKVTKASDLWSAGVILYEMVYQHPPFFGKSESHLLGQVMHQPVNHPKHAPGNVPVPIALHEVISNCLDRDPHRRPTAAMALNSLFFTPVSIDLQALNSLMQSSCRFGRGLSSSISDKEAERNVKDAVHEAWKKLIAINRGTA